MRFLQKNTEALHSRTRGFLDTPVSLCCCGKPGFRYIFIFPGKLPLADFGSVSWSLL
jgi:hypothetical protein